jgi:CRISPR-associated DxTHG motif protein
MKRLFTFLGTGRYEDTTYALHERTCDTPHFALALREWIAFDEVAFFLTTEAENHENWRKTRETFDSLGWAHKVVQIPSGESESELWRIFDRLTSSAAPGDAVSFDITHGFRSLPLVSLLAATFLRRAVGLELEAIYYGAFEAAVGGVTPVFDLSPFLDLLEWLSGVERFVGTGDSRPLAKLLGEVQNKAFRAAKDNPPTSFTGLACALRALSLSLTLSRPLDVGDAASLCLKRMNQTRADLDHGHARPLVPLIEQIRTTYAPLTDKSPTGQANLIHWYLERDHTVQAVTLSREWIVGFVCRLLEIDEIADREHAETVLNHAEIQTREPLDCEPSPFLPAFLALPMAAELIQVWGRTRDLRNDLAHCGFRANPLKGSKILSKAEILAQNIAKFAREEPQIREIASPTLESSSGAQSPP